MNANVGHKGMGLPFLTVGTQEWRGDPYALTKGADLGIGTPATI